MTVNLKKLHVALAGLVRDQAGLVAKEDDKISATERKALIPSPIKDVIDQMSPAKLTVDEVVSEVMSRKKAVLAAAKITGSHIGYERLLGLSAKDAPVGALMWRAMSAIDEPEKSFEALSTEERLDVLTSGETNVKNCEWHQIKGPIPDKTLAKYVSKLTKAARAALPDNDSGDSPGIVKIGGPQLTITVLRSLDGTILGASVRAHQAGGAYRDEVDGEEAPEDSDRGYYFSDVKEAAAAGVDTAADVSWSFGNLAFDAKGACLNGTDSELYWEWTGW
jgi:hypothetical protein